MTVKSEKYSNNPATTLNGSINSSVTSLTVTSASSFPADGNFRIVIDAEIMIVTAVSGTTFTVIRGAEGTTGASHTSGVAIDGSITKGAFDSFVGDNCQYDTIANLPAAEKAGRLYLASDVFELYRDNGTSWDKIGPNKTLYEVDFTSLANQNLKASGDGNYTIDGKTWSTSNTAQTSTFDILNGTGLRIIRNGSTSNPPRAEINLLNLAPNARPFRDKIYIWFRLINNSPTTANTWTHGQVFNSGLGTLQHAFGQINVSGTQLYRVKNDGTGGGPLDGAIGSDDVYVIAMDGTFQAAHYSGVWSGGWPAWSALNARGVAQWTTGTDLATPLWNTGNGGSGSMALGVSADEITAGSAACSVQLTHLKIERE